MANPGASEDILRATLIAYRDAGNSQRGGAKLMGVERRTFCNRLNRAEKLGIKIEEEEAIELPELLSGELPVEEKIEYLKKRHQQKRKALKSHIWASHKVNTKDPFALAFMGDPHVDSGGCNWTLLERDARILAETDGMYACNLGDTTDNWVGRLSALYAHNPTTRTDAIELSEWLISKAGINWLFILRGNHDCLDESTEVLTQRGWLKYHELSSDDLAFGMDPETECGEWMPIDEVVVKDFEGELNHFDSAGINLACTDNHRIIHKKRISSDGNRYTEPKIEHLHDIQGRIAIPCSVRGGSEEYQALSDEQIALAGWFHTDGGYDRKETPAYIRFYQSKDISPITDLLDECGYTYTVTTRDRKITEIQGRPLKSTRPQSTIYLHAGPSHQLSEIVGEKGVLPEWVYSLSERQFEVLLNAFMLGDGSWYPEGRSGGMLHGTKAFLEQVQILCHMNGWSARLAVARDKDWRLNIVKKQWRQMDVGAKRKALPYSGKVWCLVVKHGNFMIRRGGNVHFTGNCWTASRKDDPLYWFQRGGAPVKDWSYQFQLDLKIGPPVKVHAAHSFKGSSYMNKTHGMQRRNREAQGEADIYVQGHHHEWSVVNEENEHSGKVHWFLKARGYKDVDSYATMHGFGSQDHGATVVAIIDPSEENPVRRVHCFADLEEGAEFLNWKRSRTNG